MKMMMLVQVRTSWVHNHQIMIIRHFFADQFSSFASFTVDLSTVNSLFTVASKLEAIAIWSRSLYVFSGIVILNVLSHKCSAGVWKLDVGNFFETGNDGFYVCDSIVVNPLLPLFASTSSTPLVLGLGIHENKILLVPSLVGIKVTIHQKFL